MTLVTFCIREMDRIGVRKKELIVQHCHGEGGESHSVIKIRRTVGMKKVAEDSKRFNITTVRKRLKSEERN